MPLSLGAALGIGAASGLVGGIANIIGQNAAYDKQIQGARELWDYQWNKANSPQAQVRNLTKAGLNPAAMFGNQSPVMNSGGSMAMPTPPNYNLGVGTQSLSDLAQYIAAGAEAKKKGVEIPNIEEDTRSKVLDNDAKEFQNMLMREFGLQKASADVSLAWKNVQLAQDSHDMNLKEQALKNWSIAKEKALSECEETRRDILKKEFENKDTQIKLENEQRSASINESRSRSAANFAQAANLSADTETKNIFNKFYKDNRFKHSFMSQVVEQGREAVSKRLITDRQAEQLEYLVEQAAYANDMKEFSYWSGQVNQFVNTLGSTASQFYGAGALRELIKLRQGQQVPPASIRGFNQ